MSEDNAQLQRFEMKYLIDEGTAHKARQFVRCYLKPDDYAVPEKNYSYPVHSTYLDSPDLETYHAVISGDKNRFKLRIRYYTDKDKAVFFEVKRRTNECISKLRAKVHRDAVAPLLAGRAPQMKHLADPTGKQFHALQEFCRLMHSLRATPVSHVGYQREAWVSTADNSQRVTFDREVLCEPEFAPTLKTRPGDAVLPFQKQVILELKFTERLPGWCGEMVRALSLWRGGAPKYVLGVWTMGEHRVSNINVGVKVPMPATVKPERWLQPEPLAVPAS